MVIIIMGVSGAGKTTVGTLLALRLNWVFRDGDEFHPAANVEKMKAGKPLTDSDREPWLATIHGFVERIIVSGHSAVVACSALKEEYRLRLRGGLPGIFFVHLVGSPELLAKRMAGRQDHFMPPTLLASQLATLEPPSDAMVADIALSPAEIVEQIIRCLKISDAV